ncbi:MAG: epimerase [Chloroflexota bacterium]
MAGGTGHLGHLLDHALSLHGHQVTVLSRGGRRDSRVVVWDGRTLGAWAKELDGADAVINLAGRSVNCRYTKAHLKEMMDSRVESTRTIGRAIEQATDPPRIWLQMSTATIYAHRFDAPNDEATGRIGGREANVPRGWRSSITIAQTWEEALYEANTARTRRVALRCAMVMSAEPGGPFDAFVALTRRGLGGPIAGGRQYISWIHDQDFVRAVLFLLECDSLAGPINLAAPWPLPQRDFMAVLREAWEVPVGLPATRWMIEIGAFFLRTESELVLKSRRVVPTRLLDAGYAFDFAEWSAAAADLVARWRQQHR